LKNLIQPEVTSFQHMHTGGLDKASQEQLLKKVEQLDYLFT